MSWQQKLRQALAEGEARKRFRLRANLWFRRVPGKPGFYYMGDVMNKLIRAMDPSGRMTPEEMNNCIKQLKGNK